MKGYNSAIETSFRKKPLTITKKVSEGRPRIKESGAPKILLIELIAPMESKMPMRKMPKTISGIASLMNELKRSQTFRKRIESFGMR